MALILGILTGMLAFIPNIGAFVSGVLMVAVGFSAGVDTGIWAIATYFIVQTFDGYVLLPMVAKKTVDMPPALTLATQILASALFGILGLALADPITAMVKAALERRGERARRGSGRRATTRGVEQRQIIGRRVAVVVDRGGALGTRLPSQWSIAGDERGSIVAPTTLPCSASRDDLAHRDARIGA